MSGVARTIMVIGGGMSGITAALEASETGAQVILVEKGLYLGGRVAKLARYFPKMCPPACGLEINYKRLRKNRNIRWFTNAVIREITGSPGKYTVKILIKPRYVTAKCTACGDCVKVCPVEGLDENEYGLAKKRAIFLPVASAMPMQYAIDMSLCKGVECSECVRVCKYGAIDLTEKEKMVTVDVTSIIVATGWSPYDATKLTNLGYGIYQDVITNVQMERLLAEDGPTHGRVLRPSDQKPPQRVVFVQCAGSRDRNHLPYCSAVCCLASLKEALLLREQSPNVEITICYIDLRALGRNEDVLEKVRNDPKIRLVRGKGAKVTQDPITKELVVEAEDTLMAMKHTIHADLVVLATGMVPNDGIPCERDENGFVISSSSIIGAGCAVRPAEMASCMQNATGAALKALIG